MNLCQMDHQQITYEESEEGCPLCKALSDVSRLADKILQDHEEISRLGLRLKDFEAREIISPLAIFIGWKDIADALGFTNRWGARNFARKNGLPLVYLGRRPTISLLELQMWWYRHYLEKKVRKPRTRTEMQIGVAA